MKIVLKLVDVDGQEIHEILLDRAVVPDEGDYITFEVRPGGVL